MPQYILVVLVLAACSLQKPFADHLQKNSFFFGIFLDSDGFLVTKDRNLQKAGKPNENRRSMCMMYLHQLKLCINKVGLFICGCVHGFVALLHPAPIICRSSWCRINSTHGFGRTDVSRWKPNGETPEVVQRVISWSPPMLMKYWFRFHLTIWKVHKLLNQPNEMPIVPKHAILHGLCLYWPAKWALNRRHGQNQLLSTLYHPWGSHNLFKVFGHCHAVALCACGVGCVASSRWCDCSHHLALCVAHGATAPCSGACCVVGNLKHQTSLGGP